jgi:3-mercaptopyruvate sulfurtransferase SseA
VPLWQEDLQLPPAAVPVRTPGTFGGRRTLQVNDRDNKLEVLIMHLRSHLGPAGPFPAGPPEPRLPDMLVDADWVQAHLDDPDVVPVEVDHDASAYDKGHLKGAVKLDWKQDLQDPRTCGFIDEATFETLLSSQGIANDDTVILYGGCNNWFAAWAYWYFKVYGHRSVRLLDGGREKWELGSREMVTEVPHRPATAYRARKPERWIRMLIRTRTRGA